MAAPTVCCVHVNADIEDILLPISDKSRVKILQCKEEWASLEGMERSVAINLDTIQGFNNVSDGTIDPLYGYHKKCYMRFTDITKIEKAKKRLKNRSNVELAPQKRPRLISARNPTSSIAGIFPYICILCEKDQYVRETHSGKRRKEKLVQCQTYNASEALRDSALQRCDERVLSKIRDIDCIAKEVKYHKRCYRSYTNSCSSKTDETNRPNSCSYKEFCCTVIEKQIISNSEIMRMNKLTRLFIETVKKSDNRGHAEINNRQLKRWLLRDYPQLVFVKPLHRNLSELVLCNSGYDEPHIFHNLQQSSSTETTDSESEFEGIMESNKSTLEDLTKELNASEGKRNLYSSAIFLRNIITDSPPLDCNWPPTAEDLTREAILKLIPPLLFNFLVWCVGITDDVEFDSFVNLPEHSERKLLSIAQDIVYLSSNGRKSTPKHLSLAMATRHVTGSAKMIGILNGLGHCVSHSAVLEHDTALAEMQLRLADSIPMGIISKSFTTLVWDNIDFCEETLSGHGTTHSTNGIIIQQKHDIPIAQPVNTVSKKTRKRTIDPPVTSISSYYAGKKSGPEQNFSITCCEATDVVSGANNIDAAYVLCKLPELTNGILPGWTGFNTHLQLKVPPLSTIRYLPVVDANPTDMSTVYTLLCRSISIADKLELEELVLVFDQAIYAKAQQIRWKDDSFQRRLVIRLGEFHISMTLLAILGKRFKDAGLSDIIIESGIVAEGSLNGVINGKHYNRSIRAHKLVFEGLFRLLWTVYLDSIPKEQLTIIRDVSERICELYANGNLNESVLPLSFNVVMKEFNEFVEENCKINPTFAFWISYLDIVSCLLRFVRATRVGDWQLHLAAINDMIPWFFAYDRVNYARYLPVYFLEMINLPITHPLIHENLSKGEFVAQRHDLYSFSGTACDQVIEQTANKDSKTKGGLTGITQNHCAVHRWMLSHHLRAQISLECEQLAGKDTKKRKRKDLDKTRILKDETGVVNVVNTISSMVNPFSGTEDGIVNISSGVLANAELQKHLETAHTIGTLAYKKYRETCLLPKEPNVDIFSPIKLNKLRTFTDAGKTNSTTQKLETVTLKATTNLLARIIVSRQALSLDMKEILGFSLSPFPPALSNHSGSLVKTNKAALIHCLLDLVEPQTHTSIPSGNKVLILDGMAIIQQIRTIPKTFGELALHILRSIVGMCIHYGAQRVDFVTDRYPTISIKNSERLRRATCGTTLLKTTRSDQKTPKQFQKFLSSGSNKEALVQFLFEEWIKIDPASLQGVCVTIAHRENCHSLTSCDGQLLVEDLPQLCCDHEEADTRMLLHASQASNSADSIIIKSSDTDVLILALATSVNINANLYVVMGPASNTKLVDISYSAHKLGRNICVALIGLHAFTGCDSTSAFKGKGKVKAVKLMRNNDKYIQVFQQLGESWDISTISLQTLESFVCELYGQSKYNSVNECRYALFNLRCKTDLSLPPNYDALVCHILRANYQACIFRRCITQVIAAPSPAGNGWLVEQDKITIEWNSIPYAPECLLKQVSCACRKTSCSTNKCSCRLNKLFCSDICECTDCVNFEEESDDNYYNVLPTDEDDKDSDSDDTDE